ncbi:hypothetical protein DSL72_006559 [Monilinia vaccinii-corymbosi]|uniref:Carrier domain-containing protein n=1 Tax=Monilinia vaccinii-corymbosi TaxID=61207 RepID=A0A8A3PMP7_9HELO|nr:hypothetical protein DSL72_006559 [Monilinia vaccinii-corymbosi]
MAINHTCKKILLFGDQNVLDLYSSIFALYLRERDSVDLRHFLAICNQALKIATSSSSYWKERQFPPFETVLELAERLSTDTKIEVALTTVLLCVVQLGNLILLSQKTQTIFAGPSEVKSTGICTGALVGAVLDVATSVNDLLVLAPAIVRIALRIGIAASLRSSAIENSQESWAILVSAISRHDLDAAIESFESRHHRSDKQVFISASTESSFTVTGPPSVLAEFIASGKLKLAKHVSLPLGAAFHAPHLPTPNIHAILQTDSLPYSAHIPKGSLVSTTTGKPYDAATFSGLLEEVIYDVFSRPINLEGFAKGLACIVGESPVSLIPVGPENCANYFKRKLQELNCQLNDAEYSENWPRVPITPRYSGSIAIVGMAGRFPGGETLEDFWKTLENGSDLHKKIPADRFDVNTHCDPSGKLRNSTLTPYGVFMDNPGHFDARMFNMSPREAIQTDPMQRLLLMTTYEALEMSGYSPNRTPSTQSHRIGSFFGQTSDDWREVNAAQDIDTYFITGGIRAFGPGRLNYHFKWEGPSYSIDTACSSSFASIQVACSALRALECDTAVAGGANILTASDLFSGLSRGGFLSPTGGCKTFDDSADGYCRGDAVGTVILKRLEDAMDDNDNILSVIRGIDTNHSAQAVSITHPHKATQQKLFRSVLHQANLLPEDVDYVEMHGTGTQAGDFTELSAVSGLFGKDRSRNRPLYIGTLKPNVGHGEAASGVTSLIKAVMMLRKNHIPPHVGIKGSINRRLPSMSEANIVLPREKTVWSQYENRKRTILINNFDAAGGNTSLLVEDPPSPRSPQIPDPRKHHVVAISGRTPKSLRGNQVRLLQYLQKNTPRLEDIAYTTTARRQHHIFRAAYECESISSLISSLTEDVKQSVLSERMPESSTVFVFTGQGSEWAGMGKQLYESSNFCRTIFHQHDAICVGLGFPSFLNLLLDVDMDLSIASPIQVQLAIVSFELTLASLWQNWGVRPSFTIGHSLGEYPALVTSGILSLSDMFFLVGSRARITQDSCSEGTHSMLAVKTAVEHAEEILLQHQSLDCNVACINSPSSTVLSGPKHDIAELKKRLDLQNIKSTVLGVRYAFHSAQMDPVLEKYRQIIESVRFAKATIPFASAYQSRIIETGDSVNSEYLVQQTRQPVKFLPALQVLKTKAQIDSSTMWLDLGPRPICLNMVQLSLNVHPSRLIAVNDAKRDFWHISAQSLVRSYNGGINIQWGQYHEEHESHLTLLELPSYAFDLKNYWIQYEGDWSLTKGVNTTQTQTHTPEAFKSTTLQAIESENYQGEQATVIFSSNLAEQHLRAAVVGHSVSGMFLCPSSVYGDMAMGAAAYVFSKTHPNEKMLSFDVCNMEVTKPLIANDDGKDQWIQIIATKQTDDEFVSISISSLEKSGTLIKHASCIVKRGNGADWMSKWARNAFLVKERIETLIEGVSQRRTQQIHRPMAYKLFSSLVKYDKKYQGMQQVYLNSDLYEAAAEIEFQSANLDGSFHVSPYWIDSILHLSGFVLNGSERTPEDTVYISHGWRSMRIARPLSASKTYRNYVRMQPTDARGVLAGDIYVFEENEIVAVCKGLKFQEIKRKILDRLPLMRRSDSSVAMQGAIKPPTSKIIANLPTARESRSDFDEILEIIASEAEINLEELTDNAHLAELGIDSLLAIGIVERIRALEKGADIPSSIFFDFQTVSQLRTFFLNNVGSDDSSDQETASQSEVLSTDSSATCSSGIVDEEILSNRPFPEILKTILSQELEIPESEILPSTRFAEIGVDSLMALNIASLMRLEACKNIDSNFFFDYPSFGDVLKLESKQRNDVEHFESNSISNETCYRSRQSPKATSVVLQQSGNSNSAIFLFPDGAGSAASYAGLPQIHPITTVYGLNSPFLKSPTDFNGTMAWIVSLYVDEVRARQKAGPYILGGWSIGGIYAYEAARQLIIQGEEVSRLVLIDSPCPTKLPSMTLETIDRLEELGTFDGFAGSKNGLSSLVRQHFQASILALEQYRLKELPDGKKPHCLAISAKEGVLASAGTNQKQQDNKEVESNATNKWLMQARTEREGDGWEELFSNFERRFVGGNHFTMMQRPAIKAVAELISKFIEKC